MHAPGPTTPRAWPGGAKAPPTPGSSEDAPAGAAFARRNSLNCRTPAPKGLLPPTRRSRGGGGGAFLGGDSSGEKGFAGPPPPPPSPAPPEREGAGGGSPRPTPGLGLPHPGRGGGFPQPRTFLKKNPSPSLPFPRTEGAREGTGLSPAPADLASRGVEPRGRREGQRPRRGPAAREEGHGAAGGHEPLAAAAAAQAAGVASARRAAPATLRRPGSAGFRLGTGWIPLEGPRFYRRRWNIRISKSFGFEPPLR